jgi:hypothetical protein
MATKIPENMGFLLADTTASLPPVTFADPVPTCPVCASFLAQYDASALRLSLTVSSDAAQLPEAANVVIQAGGAVRRYTPPPQAVDQLGADRGAEWYLPIGVPSPERMLLVLRFSHGDVMMDRSIEVTLAR